MLRWMLLAMWAVAGCDESSDANFESSATTTTKPKAGAGFSADLAKTIGSDSAANPKDVGAKDAVKSPSSDSPKDAVKDEAKDPIKDGSKDSKDAAKDSSKDGSKDGSKDATKDGSKDATKDGSKDIAKDGSKDGSKDAPKEPVKVGSKDPPKDVAKDASRDVAVKDASKDARPAVKTVPINLAAARVPVKPSAELAAIRLSLEPNWDRDVGEAGTISLVVKVPGKEDTRVFAFRYGYEDAKAPTDREAYKKWLEDNRILKPSLDRQRGPAWYLEGQDGNGAPAFRIVVTYGGKKLVCGGSLYKDAASNQLGDIRDKTLIQAKEICETLQL